MSNKELYDFIVQELKNDKLIVNKENIDYPTDVVKSTLENPETASEILMPIYKFVNPYTKKFGLN